MDAASVPHVNDWPDRIREASRAISPHLRRTPVLEIPGDELGVDGEIAMKLEYLQHSGSFKARGATHFLTTQPVGPAGVAAASGGNHGAAVAWAAHRFGHEANIFVPTISDPAKVDRLRSYGATVHQVGDVYAESLVACEAFIEATGATSIHAYDDPVVMAGAGTTALEFEQQRGELDVVYVACGGGGLAGGMARWFGEHTKVIVCETETTTAYASAVAAGRPVDVAVSGLAADALGATRIGTGPWEALSAVSAPSILVTDDELRAARDELWERYRILVEPSAATPFAALRSRPWNDTAANRIGILLCGANTARS